jgi:hypothetical protein
MTMGQLEKHGRIRGGREAISALMLAIALFLHAGAADARSRAAKAEFQRQNWCPATNHPRGPCPGYEIDHITPLKCGGADSPHNMQWLTVAQHKIKTASEAGHCRRKRGTPNTPHSWGQNAAHA